MPAATPLPHGPTVLTLYGAEDLLTAPGCPVCRYAGEASDRYFGWFALEGHAQPGMIATLAGSLGMCAAHSRRLIGQPGAAVRLTAVYRYVVTAARDRLAGSTAPVAPCPACEHDDAAAGRALETLVDGLDDGSVADRCRDLGGLCLPHLSVASGGARRRVVAWLGETVRATLAAGQDRIGWLAGVDHDAGARAALRASIPAADTPAPCACPACLAALRAERDSLAVLPAGPGRTLDYPNTAPALCPGHLADAAAAAATAGGLRALLASQAAVRVDGNRPDAGRSRWRPAALHRDRSPRCPVCRARGEAEQRALTGIISALRSSPPEAGQRVPLCARHHLGVRAAAGRASEPLARQAAATADQLARDLAAEFDGTTWARRQGAPAPEPVAWRRAAEFLDGTVFGASRPSR